jgi:adenine-specific DNA-methyltransferase
MTMIDQHERIVTHGPKYLGSTKALLPHLMRTFAGLTPNTALDVFSGTTRVAQMLRAMGVRAITSDISTYSRVFSRAWVSGQYDMKFVDYHAALLDRLTPIDGWFTRTYCDAPGASGGIVRFMHPDNGMRVDAIRNEIARLHAEHVIDDVERDVLVATLILAMDKTDNTVAIQQAYLKEWCVRSLRRMTMQTYIAPMGPCGSHVQGDVLTVTLPSADVAYLDPPYTGVNYSSNYHIWETIARGDEPDVCLRTNRRADAAMGRNKSPWTSRSLAVESFRTLLGRLDVGHVIVSYGGSSVISIEQLCDVISETRELISCDHIDVSENIMSKIGNGSDDVTCRPLRREWLLVAK